jgi:hypothetical protein
VTVLFRCSEEKAEAVAGPGCGGPRGRIGPAPGPVAKLSGRAALLTGHEMASEDRSQTTISHRRACPVAVRAIRRHDRSVDGSVEIVALRGQIPSAAIADRDLNRDLHT